MKINSTLPENNFLKNDSLHDEKNEEGSPVFNIHPSIRLIQSVRTTQSGPMILQLSNPMQNYAIVVPCCNEEKRFPFQEYLSFAKNHPELLLCFVNNGSKDKTLTLLRGLQSACPGNISVLSLAKNSSSSDAVQQGQLYMHQKYNVEISRFLVADLATKPEKWLPKEKYKEEYTPIGAMTGSRMQHAGAHTKPDKNHSLFTTLKKKLTRFILRANFLIITLLIHSFISNAQTETIASGSLIINMGATNPNTI
jgi:glycosyltransferase involved in cell wall biosynthesis